ncbi:nucleoplasmin-3 isoform X1 [Eumetopias jubatus]|uniref:nucleoplasmin-3 isoform X1 n=1 Tax=Eumetopias jubatus TaxID=34886 RepID=UPI0010167CF8|nr:nucleoplasmin-3 isoform X1 [Eumetopias jubatus]
MLLPAVPTQRSDQRPDGLPWTGCAPVLSQTPAAPLIGGAGASDESPALYVSGAEFPDGPCSMAAGAAAALAFLSQESRARAGGIGGLRVPAPVTMDSFFFGCELSCHTRSFTFKVEEEDDSEHVLALTMLCLTEGAKDECNVVEVVARNHDHQEIAVPVANLKLSCQPMLSLDDFQLQPPVTFRLKSGSGPVRITGRHQIVTISNDVSEQEESEEEGSEQEEAEWCPILPAKKQGGRP